MDLTCPIFLFSKSYLLFHLKRIINIVQFSFFYIPIHRYFSIYLDKYFLFFSRQVHPSTVKKFLFHNFHKSAQSFPCKLTIISFNWTKLCAQLDEDHRFHIILACVLEISIRSRLTISRVRIDYRPRLSSIHDACCRCMLTMQTIR